MSETNTQPTVEPTTDEAKPDFQPITSQEQLNAVLGERLARERNKFADYDELKAKAAKLDHIEEANTTQTDKLSRRIEALEAENAAYALSALRNEVTAAKGLPATAAQHLVGSSRDELEASADSLAALIAGPKKNPPTVPLLGQQPNPDPRAAERAWVDDFVERNRR